MTIKEGQCLTRGDGALIRIDRIANGQVYYVAWRANEETGTPLRKLVTDFKIQCLNEGMVSSRWDTGATSH